MHTTRKISLAGAQTNRDYCITPYDEAGNDLGAKVQPFRGSPPVAIQPTWGLARLIRSVLPDGWSRATIPFAGLPPIADSDGRGHTTINQSLSVGGDAGVSLQLASLLLVAAISQDWPLASE